MSIKAVGVILPNGILYLESFLAVIKAGRPLIPISPSLPESRIRHILIDASVTVVITNTEWTTKVKSACSNTLVKTLLNAESNCTETIDHNKNLRKVVSESEDNTHPYPLYILYTSGSTGMPKGVQIKEKSLLYLLHWSKDHFFVPGEQTKALQTISNSFDFSILEILSTILFGGTLYFYGEHQLSQLNELISYIDKNQINTIHATPTFMTELVKANSSMPSLKLSHLGAEKLHGKLVNQIRKKANSELRVFNSYGPTEATIMCTTYTIPHDKNTNQLLSIGKPVAGSEIYIVDENGQVVPPGIAGEICIGGTGLMMSYLNKPELTNKKLIRHPFRKDQLIYKSGDLGKWLANGKLYFMGRNDTQVKIRGHRIELEEIENTILQLGAVKNVVVLKLKERDALAAFVIADTDIEADIRTHLSQTLPDYMIPSFFMMMKNFPVTSNGKVDRVKLQEAFNITSHEPHDKNFPRNMTDRILSEIWKRILGVSSVEINDNFFNLGGHSIKANQLIYNVSDTFDVALSFKEVFSCPVLKGQSDLIENKIQNHSFPLSVATKSDYYPTTSAQKRIWFIDQLQGSSTEYNLPYIMFFDQKVDRLKLEQALQVLCNRQESLRTYFMEKEGTIYQQIQDRVDITLTVHNLSSDVEHEQRLISIFQSLFHLKFDLSQAPLLRAQLCALPDSRSAVVLNLHHIIADGWSLSILDHEIREIYQSVVAGKEVSLTTKEISYKDYAVHQAQQLAMGHMIEAKNYWTKKLSRHLPVLDLPSNHLKSEEGEDLGNTYTFEINHELKEKLQYVADHYQSSLYSVLLTTFNILLHKLSSQETILIGIPVMGRQYAATNDLIGCFLNTVIIKSELSPDSEFQHLLQQTQQNISEALQYQEYPFEELVQDLGVVRDLTKFPLTSVYFNMLNSIQKVPIFDKDISKYYVNCKKNIKFNLNCYILDKKQGLSFFIDYKAGLYNIETIRLLVEKYVRLLNIVPDFHASKVSDLNTENRQNRQGQLTKEKKSVSSLDQRKNIVQVFKEISKTYSDKTAIVDADHDLTYKELDEYTDEYARILHQKSGEYTALYFSHNQKMVIGILSALKAGKTYIPLDPDHPAERNIAILEQVKPNIIITDTICSSSLGDILSSDMEIINLDEINIKETATLAPIDMPTAISAPAYILFTSGSTGKPKGVMQTHESLLNFIYSFSDAIRLGPDDKITGFSSYCHDASNNELFGALLNGATYYPLSLKNDLNLFELSDWLKQHKITVWHSVPTLFRSFAEIHQHVVHDSIRIIKMAGETVRKTDFEKFKTITNKDAKFVVSLGSTEISYAANNILTHKDVLSKSTIPVGHVIDGVDIKIIDKHGKTLGKLEKGEIVINTPTLFKGYFNQQKPEDSFIEINGKTYFRTKDYGRMLYDGTIEVLSRLDTMVKVRGNRVDLAEVEEIALADEAVRQCIVTCRQTPSHDTELIAYITTHSPATDYSDISLFNRFRKSLPDYMVPAHCVVLKEFPLTPTGKTDRNALPSPPEIRKKVAKPRNVTETELIKLWKKVLNVHTIGIHDNFFSLGGNSIKSMQLNALINKYWEIKVPLKLIFTAPTISEFAPQLSTTTTTNKTGIKVVSDHISYDTTAAQKRLWVLQQLDSGNKAYNLKGTFRISGNLKITALQKSLEQVVQRHDVLRTTFFVDIDALKQKIHAPTNIDSIFEVVHIKDHLNNYTEEIENASEVIFNLETGPLLKVVVYQASHETILIFVIHHIIADGWSMQIFFRDLLTFYQSTVSDKAPVLPDLTIQYKDFTAWQKGIIENDSASHTFWMGKLQGDLPRVDMPTDFIRPPYKTYNGGTCEYGFTPDLIKQLDEWAISNNSSRFMVLVSALNILVYYYTRQSDIVIGTPVAGRESDVLDNQMGLYTNTIVLRNSIDFEESVSGILNKITVNTLESLEHQNYPFDQLVNHLSLPRDPSRSPIFDIFVILQNYESLKMPVLADLELSPVKQKSTSSKFDLTFNFKKHAGDRLSLELEYNADLFKKGTILLFLKHLNHILAKMIESPNTTLKNLVIPSLYDEDRLVNDGRHFLTTPPIYQILGDNKSGYGHKPAIRCGNTTVTYEQLDSLSNQLAVYLRSKYKIKPNDLVGIMTARNEWLIIGILGILKSGGAYLPLDPSHPLKRNDFVLEDSGAKILLTDDSFTSGNKRPTIIEDVTAIDLKQYSCEPPEQVNTLNDLAYLMYTSGSTGKPKGVRVKHSSLANFLSAIQTEIAIKESDLLLALTTHTFDISVLELLLPLKVGATIYLATRDEASDPMRLSALIGSVSPDFIQATPTTWSMLIQTGWPGSKKIKAISGGEKLQIDLGAKLLNRVGILWNMYGPTETTIWSTTKEIRNINDLLSVGNPISNTSIYIMDDSLQMLPKGFMGEICIGGEGVSDGYHNRENQTREKFTRNPYTSTEIIYKTGDLGRINFNGELVVLGRKDDEVKIRGHRISLGEVEAALVSLNGIGSAAVVVSTDPISSANYITAYLVKDTHVTIEQVREYASTLLPQYMLPSQFLTIDQMPLTDNGKVDRRGLKKIKVQKVTASNNVVAETSLEKDLIALWKKVLASDTEIGIDNNFFEIGGDSMKVIGLYNLMKNKYPGVLEVYHLYSHSTIRKLARFISSHDTSTPAASKIEQVDF